MVIEDFSYLRPPEDRIPIPLNGATYYAVADPPAEVIVAATASPIDEATATRLQAAGVTNEASLANLVETDLVTALRLSAVGSTNMERAIRFIQQVLEPASRRPFADAMRPLPEDPPPTAEQIADHDRVRITMPQVTALYRALLAQYTGRPTVPSSPSPAGHDGNGQSLTESVPLTAPTPASYVPPAS